MILKIDYEKNKNNQEVKNKTKKKTNFVSLTLFNFGQFNSFCLPKE